MDILEKLETFDFFSDTERGRLSEIAEKGKVSEFGKESIIFKANEPAGKLYGVLDGDIDLILVFEEEMLKTDIKYEESIVVKKEIIEKPIVVDVAGPGDIFGWSSLVPPKTYTVTARCKTTCNVFSIDADWLGQTMDHDPVFGYRIRGKLNETIGRRMRNTTANLIEAWGQAFGIGVI